ncbi:MAG: MFS transporter [Methanomicrobiales archaeon]|nr:MFS transporter [Methanomicrobiales archaeon]
MGNVEEKSGDYKIALFIAVLAGFLTPFDLSAVNIALPTIGREFAMDAVSMSWIPTAYLLTSAIFLVPIGRVADIYGRKKVCTVGLSLFTLASISMILSPIVPFIILSRVWQGVGGAFIFGTAIAILTSLAPRGERGKALGIYTTAVYLGLSFGPSIGGFMTDHLGWRSIFLINIPIGVVAVSLLIFRLRGEWADAQGERFDLHGSLLYGLMLLALIYGLSMLPSTEATGIILAGAALFILFLWYEWHTRSPLIDLYLFRYNRRFAFSNLAALLNYSATFAVTFFLSLYLQYIGRLSPSEAGLILIVQPVIQALFASSAGYLSDRVDPGKVASAGMALNAIALLSLALLDEGSSIAHLGIILFVMGAGLAFFSSPNTNAIMSSVEPKCYGVASGTLGTMRLMGQMLSMAIAMMLIAIFMGRVEIIPEQYSGLLGAMKAGFLVFACLCIVGIFASLSRGEAVEEERGICRVDR